MNGLDELLAYDASLAWEPRNREELLRHYASVEQPSAFLQIDGFHLSPGEEDYVLRPDADGDAMMFGDVLELRHHPEILRVLVPVDMDTATAVRQLRKMAAGLKRFRGTKA